MFRRIAVLVLFLAAFHLSASGSPAAWVEVQSPHFTLVTDAGDQQGRRVLDQFERMRGVFRTLFPHAHVDPPAPVLIIAAKDQEHFEALEPLAYLAKDKISLAGLFLNAEDKNYILLRLDADGAIPCATIYHEYTHLQLSYASDWLPLWLNEGLAEFFQNTDIRDTGVQLGKPSFNDLLYLRQNGILPLPALFQVDVDSLDYHDQQKGSIFYAESWALTHYLEITDRRQHTHRLVDYAKRVNRHEDPVAAAGKAFGDLNRLQKALESYIAQTTFEYLRISNAAVPIDDASFKVRTLTPVEADAICADFLAYNQRAGDARALLATVLQRDPGNLSAHETLGLLEMEAGHREAARQWYEQAIKLDSQSYLVYYYYAAISIAAGSGSDAGIENSLRMAIQLNPRFAPAYDQLASFYEARGEKPHEARMLKLQAMSLEPGGMRYRLSAANVLLEEVRPEHALHILRPALSAAKMPDQVIRPSNPDFP